MLAFGTLMRLAFPAAEETVADEIVATEIL
jgi:hypothetical protein